MDEKEKSKQTSLLTPADLRRLPDEQPETWLARLQQIRVEELSLALQLTRNRYLVQAEEMLRQAQEIAREQPRPVETRRVTQSMPSALERLKAGFLALSPAERQAFVGWLPARKETHAEILSGAGLN